MSTDDTSATAAAGPVFSEGLGPLPKQRVLDRHLPTGVALYGYNAEDMMFYAAQERAAERERWRGAAAAALEWMEGAWLRIDGEWGPSGKTLDQECADGDEPEIAALRALLRA